MEIDDTGKERRNALLVSALIFAAAFLHLKVPSILAEFFKFELNSTYAYRAWLLAACLAGYVSLRYHFSDARKAASLASNQDFALSIVTDMRHIFHDRPVDGGVAFFHWQKLLGELGLADSEFVAYVSPRHFRVRAYRLTGHELRIRWQIDPALLTRHDAIAHRIPDEIATETDLNHASRAKMKIQGTLHRLFWSKSAIEVTTVYVVGLAAIAICLHRAYTLFHPAASSSIG
ncbi:hypothetical protein KYT87_21325 [Achromobacter sp. ES-001]|uniref:hypothetical protein n=1 Tax=Achromobacter sp. ES-001 TaxID=2860286 RepID=UPI001C6419F5|nr:hypothetical protein [Achromobacter sp. ES-001]QYJ20196.1 hypothetical protein KYT87_21325 [Achromobacter sp. ES-001]